MEKEELYNKYKKGLINNEEYTKLLNNISTNNLSLQEKLELKLLKEFNDFTTKLLKKSKSEIIDSAYEITCKQEIQDMLYYSDIDDKEIEALLKEDDLINDFYQDWLDEDTALGDSMEYCISESIARVTKYYYKHNPINNNERSE